jgi:hypothetical protein
MVPLCDTWRLQCYEAEAAANGFRIGEETPNTAERTK